MSIDASRRDFLYPIRIRGLDHLRASVSTRDAADGENPLAARKPQLPATAKNVIFLFMHGGPSHLETFDPKPLLEKLDGNPVPDSFGDVQLQFSTFKKVPILASRRKFQEIWRRPVSKFRMFFRTSASMWTIWL